MQTNNLEAKRHSLAHLLAAAVMQKFPHAKATIGPAVDNGFYYDFDFSDGAAPSESDLKALEAMMRNLLPSWTEFSHKVVSPDEAREFFKGNEYKTELINDLEKEGATITFYTCGGFTDLCRGGHSEHPATEIPADSFTLERMAGAYWRGDEKNKMLTRIYGLAFESKEALGAYTMQIEEAKKRDHRKLGKELGLFVFSELVGPGLPLWTPKGTMIRETLNEYVWELRKAKGYQRVQIPHITKKDLYETSGHWAKFADELFKIKTREDHLFAMKPMNCPHHTQIYASEQHSYRELPIRYCETTMVYRDEQTGELSGLSRVLSITQDDAHVFCRENQIQDEVFSVWDIIDTFYGKFGFSDTKVRFSRHDPDQFEKYLGTKEIWDKAESQIKELIKKRGIDEYIDGLGEAAMYGPKIDFIAKDSIGRTHQVATIQLDFNQPKNFGLYCINEKGEKEQVVMIHCAIMGSIERFMSVMIEHTAGAFPLWVAPVQVKVLPISDTQMEYASNVFQTLKDAGIRVELDDSSETLGKKIRAAAVQKIPYTLVIGDKEIESNMVTVESRDHGKLGAVSIEDAVARFKAEIANKK